MAGFPNVPNVPGVPPLLRSQLSSFASLGLLRGDVASAILGLGAPQWGIFSSSGSPVVLADNVLTMEYRQDWSIADFPIEQGGFESYDKVNNPFMARIRFGCGGSVERRQAFLNSISNIAGDLKLYNVVTPEQVYLNVNIARYDYKRSADSGLGLMQVEVHLLEIRQNTATAFSATKSPSGASPTNNGTVQAVTPAGKISSAIAGVGAT